MLVGFLSLLKEIKYRLSLLKVGKGNKRNREKWLRKTLNNIPKGKKILDAGAGELQYKKFCSHLDYTSQDFCQYDGKGDERGLQAKKWDTLKIDIVSDITNIPVDDNSFDAIMCIEVLEHLFEPVKAIKEFARILKPKGKLILTAPFCSLTHQAPYHFYTGYNRYWHERVLEENGFLVEEMNYNGDFFEYLAQELRRIPFIEKKYTKLKISRSFLNKTAINILLKMLNELSSKNKGSEELLCFGLQILAKKE